MSGKWSKQSRAYHESVQAHVSARMREAVEEPTKRDLQEMLIANKRRRREAAVKSA